MNDKLGIGLIGCGGIAHSHLAGWQAAPDLCEVRGLADPNPDALRRLHAKAPEAATYADYAEMLARDDIGAVEVLTPPGLHHQNASDALNAGKDVLIIKPFTVELSHADELIALAGEKGARLMAGQPLRFDAHMRKARQIIESGRIGRPVRFYSRGFMRQEWLRKATHWFSNLSLSGGITIENIVHQTDAMSWMGGRVKSVFGYAGTFHTSNWPGGGLPDDQISFLMRFESGAIGVVEGGTAQPTGMPASMFEITGTEGGMTIDRNGLTVGRGVLESEGHAERFEFRGDNAVHAMLRAFLESILEDREVPITAAEGKYAVEICWAALQSVQTGRQINLPIAPANYPTYR